MASTSTLDFFSATLDQLEQDLVNRVMTIARMAHPEGPLRLRVTITSGAATDDAVASDTLSSQAPPTGPSSATSSTTTSPQSSPVATTTAAPKTTKGAPKRGRRAGTTRKSEAGKVSTVTDTVTSDETKKLEMAKAKRALRDMEYYAIRKARKAAAQDMPKASPEMVAIRNGILAGTIAREAGEEGLSAEAVAIRRMGESGAVAATTTAEDTAEPAVDTTQHNSTEVDHSAADVEPAMELQTMDLAAALGSFSGPLVQSGVVEEQAAPAASSLSPVHYEREASPAPMGTMMNLIEAVSTVQPLETCRMRPQSSFSATEGSVNSLLMAPLSAMLLGTPETTFRGDEGMYRSALLVLVGSMYPDMKDKLDGGFNLELVHSTALWLAKDDEVSVQDFECLIAPLIMVKA